MNSRRAHIDSNVRKFLSVSLSAAKARAKERTANGRSSAGQFELTIDWLMQLIVQQSGLCYYSKIPLNFQTFSDWQCSLERLNSSEGYTQTNTVLIAGEFQGQCQWTKEKFTELAHLLSMTHGPQSIDWSKKKRAILNKEIIVIAKDGVDHCNCVKCDEIKPLTEFNKHLRDGCKECKSKRYRLHRETGLGHMQKLLDGMKRHTLQKPADRQIPPCSLTVRDLVEIFEEQLGLCYYSGIPLNFGSHFDHWWTCSPERLNVNQGYTKDNTRLVCLEFNTSDKRILAKESKYIRGGAFWTKEKLTRLMQTIENVDEA